MKSEDAPPLLSEEPRSFPHLGGNISLRICVQGHLWPGLVLGAPGPVAASAAWPSVATCRHWTLSPGAASRKATSRKATLGSHFSSALAASRLCRIVSFRIGIIIKMNFVSPCSKLLEFRSTIRFLFLGWLSSVSPGRFIAHGSSFPLLFISPKAT